MDDNQDNQDLDAMARNQAALAAQARAREVAAGIAQEHADSAYERARQNAVGYAANNPDGRPRRWDVPPPPPPPPRQVVPGIPVVPPPPPGFATGAIAALANVSSAMTAIVDTLARRTGNNSHGHDGDVVVYKDISPVFGEVPEGLLERVQQAAAGQGSEDQLVRL